MPSHGSVTKSGKVRQHPGSRWAEHLARYEEWRELYGDHQGKRGHPTTGKGGTYTKSPRKPPNMRSKCPRVSYRRAYLILKEREKEEKKKVKSKSAVNIKIRGNKAYYIRSELKHE